ncbi:MAG: epoxyqueuosine reductase QueH [Deltaproteobacteria bacterium]|nr:epoxyqueuosine reductase QueH [Deltaproteobacteria bacterium]
MKVLLHICCAPCAIYPLSRLAPHEVVGYFYNPNIHPYAEHQLRQTALVSYAALQGLKVIMAQGYEVENFFRRVNNRENDRCPLCYELRLENSARVAKQLGCNAISTTLLYSKYQRHDMIRKLCEQAAARHGLDFIYEDFREGWLEGIAASKKLELYRQRYCGCIYSERERFLRSLPSS